MFKIHATILAGLVSVMSAAPASAITMKATFTATVSNSDNDGGLFLGGSLDGKTALVEFLYDPSLPGSKLSANTHTTTVSGGTNVPGGTFVNPILSASVTIDGVTQFVNGSYYGQAQNSENSLLYQRSQTANGGNLEAFIFSNLIPLSLETAIQLTVLPPFSGFGGFYLVDPNCISSCSPLAEGSLSITSFEVAQTPVPAALPLFASVLAGGGLIAWRKKRKMQKLAV